MDYSEARLRVNISIDFSKLLYILERLPNDLIVTVNYYDSTSEPAERTGKAGEIFAGLRELGGWN